MSCVFCNVMQLDNYIKKGEAAGPDEIWIEELEVLGEFRIEIVTKLVHNICNKRCIPSDTLNFVCIILYKRAGAFECK